MATACGNATASVRVLESRTARRARRAVPRAAILVQARIVLAPDRRRPRGARRKSGGAPWALKGLSQ